MNKVNFTYIPFSKNLVHSVLEETPPDKTVYVFPSEKSKRIGLREFQKKWYFSLTQFITMEELKVRLFRTQNPLLKEEKRTLAFYQSLSQQDKDFFNIHSYFQSIDFARKFFGLWEEFNEELVEEKNNIAKIDEMDAGIHDWQVDTLLRLLDIRSRYLLFLESKNFSDVIFYYRPQNIILDFFKGFENFVFVNQFYYTALEKKIISYFSENNRSVKIFYQLPASLVDENSLAVKYFTFANLGNPRLQKINIVETQNDFSALAQLFNFIDKENNTEIIDVSTTLTPFDNFLNILKFQTGESGFLRNTFLYEFFNITRDLLNNSVFDPVRQKWLLPLGEVMNAFLNKDYLSFILNRTSSINPVSQEAILEEISRLLDAEFKYVDSDLELFKHAKAPKFQIVCKALFGLLEQFRQLQTIPNLIDLFDTENGVYIKSLIAKDQHQCSNIEEILY